MPSKLSLKMRIFLKCLNIVSFGAFRKRPGTVFGLAFVLLLASAAYYALKYNLTKHSSQPRSHSEGFPRNIFFEESVKSMWASDDKNVKFKAMFSNMGIRSIYGDNVKPYIARERIVHLDLKGAPPRVEYFRRIFPLIKNWGATGVLIEYEDMYPYFASLTDITAHNHYSTKEVLEILNLADSSGLKIIPLIQTFGHLEFALKRPRLQHLRENADSPQALCPSQNASLVFIENMISQIMEIHQNRITHIHIGCDEVYHLMECKVCRGKMAANEDAGVARSILFLNHVINVAKIIKKGWPEVRPLIWDDMIRNIPEDLLKVNEIGKYVDPVVWWYTEDIYRIVSPIIWQKYSRVFRTAWTASAYKGAFGETQYVPNVQRHLENSMQWTRVMMEQTRYFKDGIAGIMLTGWQRYDHFAVLCELLPVSIPSLSLCLLALSHGGVNETALYKFGTSLGCPQTKAVVEGTSPITFNLNSDPFMLIALSNCIFPGSNTFRAMAKYKELDLEASAFIEEIKKNRGWLMDYNTRHGYITAEKARQGLNDLDAVGLLNHVADTAHYLAKSLDGILDEHATNEWIEQRLYPIMVQVQKIMSELKNASSALTWQRRPLKSPQDMESLKVGKG